MKSLSECFVIINRQSALPTILSIMIGSNMSTLIKHVKILETSYVSSTEQCADVFIKGLPTKTFS